MRDGDSWQPCGTRCFAGPTRSHLWAQPSYARTDVELPPTRELEYLGRVRTGIRVKDLSTGDFSYAWSQTYAVELAEPPGPDSDPFAVIREMASEPK